MESRPDDTAWVGRSAVEIYSPNGIWQATGHGMGPSGGEIAPEYMYMDGILAGRGRGKKKKKAGDFLPLGNLMRLAPSQSCTPPPQARNPARRRRPGLNNVSGHWLEP